MKGGYALLIGLPEPREVSVGRLGQIFFPRGFYAYVGCAFNGVESRIRYHLRKPKKAHWHIDYLLEQASIKTVFLYESEQRLECIMAQALSQEFLAIPGFGSSDCTCHSHLYSDAESDKLERAIERTTTLSPIVISPQRTSVRPNPSTP